MVITIKPFNPANTNEQIVDAIRYESTSDYQARIPAATKADIQETLRALNNYTPAWNEFVNALINKVGLTIARNNNWTNVLAKFKRGLLEYGESIEEIQTGLVEAYVYDPDQDYGEKAIFGAERPEVQADYHAVNRRNFYKITVNEALLKRAFLTPGGLAQFIAQLMEAPTTSDNWDEYLTMRQLFAEYEQNGGFFKVHLDAIPKNNSAVAEATSKAALREIREMIGTLAFPSRLYNAARMPVATSSDKLTLFVTPEFQAAIDVEALAALFNVAYGEIGTKTQVVDKIPIPGAMAILTTEDFFVVADTLYETTVAPNPVGLHTNYFLHHHQVVSCSRFVPAVLFWTGPGTVIEENPTPVAAISALAVTDGDGNPVDEVERGLSYLVRGHAITAPEGGLNDAVVLTLSGAESSHTYITQTGVLSVALTETSDELTITATNTDFGGGDDIFTGTVSVDVVGDVVRFWPNPDVLEPPAGP